jgi:hypothetical protein
MVENRHFLPKTLIGKKMLKVFATPIERSSHDESELGKGLGRDSA